MMEFVELPRQQMAKNIRSELHVISEKMERLNTAIPDAAITEAQEKIKQTIAAWEAVLNGFQQIPE